MEAIELKPQATVSGQIYIDQGLGNDTKFEFSSALSIKQVSIELIGPDGHVYDEGDPVFQDKPDIMVKTFIIPDSQVRFQYLTSSVRRTSREALSNDNRDISPKTSWNALLCEWTVFNLLTTKSSNVISAGLPGHRFDKTGPSWMSLALKGYRDVSLLQFL